MRLLLVDSFSQEFRAEILRIANHSVDVLMSAMVRRYVPDVQMNCLRALVDPVLDCEVLRSYHGILITGSDFSGIERSPAVDWHLRLIGLAARVGLPIFGICWGLQILTLAAGGKVRRHGYGREFPIARKIQLTEAGRAADMFKGRAGVFDAYCEHGDEVESLPDGAELLAGNNWSDVQAARFQIEDSKVWGVQYHPELTAEIVGRIPYINRDLFLELEIFESDREIDDFASRMKRINQKGHKSAIAQLYGHGEDLLDPIIRTNEVGNWLNRIVLPRCDGCLP